MAKTLEEILKESESGEAQEAFAKLFDFLKWKERNEQILSLGSVVEEIKQCISDIIATQSELKRLAQAILSRPDPVFPEQKEFPTEIKLSKPDWYIEPIEPDMEWLRGLTNSIRYDGDKTRAVLLKISEKESEEPQEKLDESKPEPKTVNSAAVRSRRTTQWRRFDNYDLKNIISQGDGVTYFLPDSLIPNSEDVKLNGGSPLKTSDYTLVGNKLVFLNGNQSNSQIEVRGQTK